MSPLTEFFIAPRTDQPWIFHLSDVLVQALSKLDSKNYGQVATAWLGTEEWQADGATARDLNDFKKMLSDLADLARKSTAERLRMYLRHCV